MKLKNKPTSDQIRNARKGGCNAKRPNKPKAGATLPQMENWGTRYNEWVDKINGGVKDGKAKTDLRDQIRKA